MVERVQNSCETKKHEVINSVQFVRVAAAHSCPEAGFYFTPARLDSRRLFQKGDVMPELGAEYGATIWQRDVNQS